MRPMRSSKPTDVVVGFAAGSEGRGIAYAGLNESGVQQIIRVSFRVPHVARSRERAVAYLALTAVVHAVRRRGVTRARFVLPDAGFAEELSNGSTVADELTLAYVRLRCALNTLAEFFISTAANDDLTQRARAEVALNIAA